VEGDDAHPRGLPATIVPAVQSRVRLRPQRPARAGHVRGSRQLLPRTRSGGQVHGDPLPVPGRERRVEAGEAGQDGGDHGGGGGADHGAGVRQVHIETSGDARSSDHIAERRTIAQRGAGIVERSGAGSEHDGAERQGGVGGERRGLGGAGRRVHRESGQRDERVYCQESIRVGVFGGIDAAVSTKTYTSMASCLQ